MTTHQPQGCSSRSVALSPAPTTRIAGVDFDHLTLDEVVHAIFARLGDGFGGHVITPNIDILRRLQRADVRHILESASMILADGAPIVWASRLLGRKLPERVTGAGLIDPLCGRAASEDKTVYILGGAPGVGEKAKSVLEARHESLAVVGVDSPPVGFEFIPSALDSVRSKIRGVSPDIVFVALGFPKQDQLAAQLRAEFPSTWFIGCGAAIDFAAGNVRRAPAWVQRIGFEWLFRLSQEPRRLARRYLVDDLPFASVLLTKAAFTFVKAKASGRGRR